MSAAYAAAANGAKIALFEKSKEIGYPVHTSGGSWLSDLEKLGIPKKFMYPIKTGYFIAPNVKAVFEYEKAEACVLDIRGLYQYLAEIASERGAEIFINHTVARPYFEGTELSGLYVRNHGVERLMKAKLVIDAGGASCFMGRELGITKGLSRYGIGAEYDLYAPDWPEGQVALLFGEKFAPKGYAWVFSYKEKRIRVGVGIIKPDTNVDPRPILENLISDNDIFSDQLKSVSRIEYHTGIIPSQGYLKHTISNNCLIAGDAGGLISTLLGEGIRFSIDIGRMAGTVASESIEAKDYSLSFLQKYEKMWQKKYKRIFDAGQFLNQRFSTYTDEKWNQKIKLLARLSPENLTTLLKGEFTPGFILKAFSDAPDLIGDVSVHLLKTAFKSA